MRRAAEWVEALHRQGGSSPDLVAAAELQSDVIYLNSGDPDRIAPPNVLEAAAAALRAGKTRYQRGPGLPELRRAIAAKHLRENAFQVDPDRVSITNGSCEGLAVVMRTLLDPGDEVLTTDPYYGGHLSAIRYAGGPGGIRSDRWRDGVGARSGGDRPPHHRSDPGLRLRLARQPHRGGLPAGAAGGAAQAGPAAPVSAGLR